MKLVFSDQLDFEVPLIIINRCFPFFVPKMCYHLFDIFLLCITHSYYIPCDSYNYTIVKYVIDNEIQSFSNKIYVSTLT